MFNGRFVSYKRVLDTYYRDFKGLPYTLNHADAWEWIGSLLALIPVHKALKKTQKVVTIVNGKGNIPCDLYGLWSVAYKYKSTIIPMQWNTDRFYDSVHLCDIDFTTPSQYQYTLNDNCIFTNYKEGEALFSYFAFNTDEDGAPMVPDSESWIMAASREIAWRAGQNLWLQDKLNSEKFAYIESERNHYLAQAANEFKILTPDEEEAWLHEDMRMITNLSNHSSRFANVSLPESIRNYRR